MSDPINPAATIATLLAECSPVTAELRAQAELFALGVTGDAITGGGPLDALHYEAVIPTTPGRFVLARNQEDQRGAMRAYVFGVRDELGELVDIAAWVPGEPVARLWQGNVAALGAEQIFAARLEPLHVHETVVDWLRAGRNGIVILDLARGAPQLEGMTLAAPTLAAGRALRAQLAPHMQRQPRIMIPRAAANG